MKIRLFSDMSGFFLAVFAFVFLAPSLACRAQELPWQRGAERQGGAGAYGQGGYGRHAAAGRRYVEPGEDYDPARHGPAGHSRYGQYGQYDRGGAGGDRVYDRGYEALRNNNRPQPSYRNHRPPYRPSSPDHAHRAAPSYPGHGQGQAYDRRQPYDGQRGQRAPRYGRAPSPYPQQGYQPPAAGGPGQPYAPPAPSYRQGSQYDRQREEARAYDNGTYSDDEILDAGHRFFGKMTKGLAKVIAHVFKKSGRPNAYILGEEGGGALIAGLRYGEGIIYTKAGERRRVYWQGPSIGYDFGAEGSKTMILVYNLRNIDEIYERFGGVDGSAYLVGGAGVTFQRRGRIVLAPIRTGVGLRLGANIGYLKYTRRPTWNPF